MYFGNISNGNVFFIDLNSAVEQIIDGLSPEDKEHLHNQEFYKKAEILRKISQRKKRPQLAPTPVLQLEDLPQEGSVIGM